MSVNKNYVQFNNNYNKTIYSSIEVLGGINFFQGSFKATKFSLVSQCLQ